MSESHLLQRARERWARGAPYDSKDVGGDQELFCQASFEPGFDPKHNATDLAIARFLTPWTPPKRRCWCKDNPHPALFPQADVEAAALEAQDEAITKERFQLEDRLRVAWRFGKDGDFKGLALSPTAIRAIERRQRELAVLQSETRDKACLAKGRASELRKQAENWELVEAARREQAAADALLSKEQRAKREQFEREQEEKRAENEALRSSPARSLMRQLG